MGLKKYVFGKHKIDIDAKKFILSAGITNTVQIRAINNLTIALKQNNIWSKILAIYPFIGGTQNSHSFNLKNPNGLASGFTLLFSGGWTHSSTGAKPNGTNAYANSRLRPIDNLMINSVSLSYYSISQSLKSNNIEIGALNGSQFSISTTALTLPRLSGDAACFHLSQINNTDAAFATGRTSTLGFFLGGRTSSSPSSLKYFERGTLIASASTNTSESSYVLSSSEIYIGAINQGSPSFFSDKECAFSSIGLGLSDTEVFNLNNIVQNYQIELGRQV